jgi:hypothetical protein
MAESNKFQDSVSLELSSIPSNYTNTSKLRHCLAAANFVADPNECSSPSDGEKYRQIAKCSIMSCDSSLCTAK